MTHPDLAKILHALAEIEVATNAGDRTFHAQVHEPIAAARKALAEWMLPAKVDWPAVDASRWQVP